MLLKINNTILHVIRIFSRLELTKKIILAVTGICIAFTGTLLYFQNRWFKQSLIEQETVKTESDGKSAQDYINLYLSQMENLTISLGTRGNLYSEDSDERIHALETFVNENSNLVDVAYFVDKENNVQCSKQINLQILVHTLHYTIPQEIARNTDKNGEVSITGPYRSSMTTEDVAAFSKHIYKGREEAGTIIIEVNLGDIISSLKTGNGLGNQKYVIFDQNDNLIYENLDSENKDLLIKTIIGSEDGWLSINDSGHTFRVFLPVTEDSRWKIAIVTDEKKLFSYANALTRNLMIVSIALFILLTISVAHIVRHYTNPISELANNVNHIDEKTLTMPESQLVNRTDEIGDLEKSIRNLLKRIRDLNEKQRLLEAEKNEAEIRSLQNQLKPHFLYNTLNSISTLVIENRTDQIPSAISALINLLKMSTDKTDSIITLRKEIQATRYYIDLMTLRYGSRFEVSIQIPNDLEECVVPKLILQPLVENAIHHGLNPIKHNGLLEIEAHENEKGIIITVTDDGIGISKDKISKLLSGGDPHSTGIRNTNERIKLQFGREYGLGINSIEGMGTMVEIQIPKILIENWNNSHEAIR